MKCEGGGRKRQREIDVTKVTTAVKRVHLGLTAIEESVLVADLDVMPLENNNLDGKKEHEGNKHQAKAVKRDDAAVRVHDWDFFLALGLTEDILARPWRDSAKIILRPAMKWWHCKQLRDGIKFKKEKLIMGDFSELDRGAITDAIRQTNAATWWEWENGSRPFYWNWNDDKQIPMQDGIELWIREKMIPSWVKAQEALKDSETLLKVIDKLMIAWDKGYISMGIFKSLIFFFDVPKGLDDIRMLYDRPRAA